MCRPIIHGAFTVPGPIRIIRRSISEPWDGYCVPADYLLAFGTGFYPFGFWAWGHFEWRHHIIRIDHDRFQQFQTGHEPPGGIWQHDPAHRHGVPYRDPATAARFLGPAGAARGYRGSLRHRQLRPRSSLQRPRSDTARRALGGPGRRTHAEPCRAAESDAARVPILWHVARKCAANRSADFPAV